MGTPKTPAAAAPRGVHVRLTPADQDALRAEAFRRVRDGHASRIDVSAVLRELVTAWREGRSS